MKSVVKTGKTVDEAVEAALHTLNATLDDVTIEILEQPKSGFLGMFGAKNAVVRVSRRESDFRSLLKEEGILGATDEKNDRADADESSHPSDSSASSVSSEESISEPNPSPSEEEEKKQPYSPNVHGCFGTVEADRDWPAPEPVEEETKLSSEETVEMTDSDSSLEPEEPIERNIELEEEEKDTESVEREEEPADVSSETQPESPSAQNTEAPSETSSQPALSIADMIHQQMQREEEEEAEWSQQTLEQMTGEEEFEEPPFAPTETSRSPESLEEDETSKSFEVESAAVEKENLESVESEEQKKAYLQHWMEDVLGFMHVQADISIHFEADDIMVELSNMTDTDMGIVIGRRAETLNALQYLMGVSLNRSNHHHDRVYLDVGGYRKRRAENISKLAQRSADKVLRYRKPVKLEPMNAYERRIVHTTLQGMEHIDTYSEGRDPRRRVVIVYRNV